MQEDERESARQPGGEPQRMWLTRNGAVDEGAGQRMSSSSSSSHGGRGKSWQPARSRHQRKEAGDQTKSHPNIFTAIFRSHACTLFNKHFQSHLSHLELSLYLSLILQPINSFQFFCAQVSDDYTVIGRNLFKKETNLQLFVGLKVTLSTGESGVIEGGFGQSGKFKIRIQGKDFQMS